MPNSYSYAGRDGLLAMYQKLLVEKEQRLREFMKLNQGGNSDYHAVVNSRSWRLVMDCTG